MTRYYVNITGVSDAELEMLGYYLEDSNGKFSIYTYKGEHFIVHAAGEQRYIYVEDVNDATLLKGRSRIAAPPKN